MHKAVFLDRDGVINVRPPEGLYITSVDELVILEGVAESIAQLNASGFLVIVVTNQRCIARGLVTAEEVSNIHQKMLKLIGGVAGRIDGVFVCPHDCTDNCDCRKPKPGMLLRAASDYSIDLHSSWMVGDSVSDIAAGQAAGCRTIMVGEVIDRQADRTTRNLPEAVSFILKVQ